MHIDLDSTYRDRTVHPFSCEFTTNTSGYDPVIHGVPLQTVTSNTTAKLALGPVTKPLVAVNRRTRAKYPLVEGEQELPQSILATNDLIDIEYKTAYIYEGDVDIVNNHTVQLKSNVTIPAYSFIRLYSPEQVSVNDQKVFHVLGYDSRNRYLTLDGTLDSSEPPSCAILPLIKQNASIMSPKAYLLPENVYTIRLISLIIPNLPLVYGISLRELPYVYCEFGDANIRNSNMLISNNPNATTATFKCPIQNIDDTSFVKLTDIGIVQTCKLNPKMGFAVKVYLPDGSPLIYKEPESYSPFEPNPRIQISINLSLDLYQE